MSLDFSKPYAEVHGLPGAMYEQGGMYFRGDGNLATMLNPYKEEIALPDDSVPPPIACYEQSSAPQDVATDTGIDNMHWKHLKALVESYGGQWTDKKAAIAFMKGKE